MTRLPTIEVDDDPPSPTLGPAPVDEDDHDDDLSINSSDLDDEGWLNVDATSAAASTASVFGSSTISDIPMSSREPSEASTSEDEGEGDDGPLFLQTSKSKTAAVPDESTCTDAEAPAASNVYEFKSSWIFPDPTSSNASLATTGTVTDNTPVHSFPNIRSVPHRSAESFIEEDESEDPDETAPEATAPVALTMPAPDTRKKTTPGNPFPAHAARAEGKRWTLLPLVIGLVVILMQLGPSPLELVAILSHKWAPKTAVAPPPPPPPPPSKNWALGTADLQIVKDTLAALTTSSAVAPKDIASEAPAVPSESDIWGKLRRSGKPSTDLVVTTVPNSLSKVTPVDRRPCKCPPKQCNCPPPASILDNLADGLIALDVYARWMSEAIAGLVYHASQWIRSEVELELKYQRELIDTFVKLPAVRTVVESTINWPQTVSQLYTTVRNRVCENGRCEQAAEAAQQAAQQAQARGWRSILQARRGLDVALTHGQRIVDDAKAASTELLDGAVAGARSAAERAVQRASEKKAAKKKTGGCKKSKGGCSGKKRRRWSCNRKGKKGDPNQRLQCGFRGYGRGCDQA